MAKNRRQNSRAKFRKPIKIKFSAVKSIFKFFLLIFLILGLSFIVFRFFSNFSQTKVFKVKRIIINDKVNLKFRNSLIGRSIFKVKLDEVYKDINAQHPEYKSIHVHKEFPDTLRISLVKRDPVAQIVHAGYYPIDKAGVITSDASLSPLPGLIPIEITDYTLLIRRGSRINDERFKLALRFIQSLENSGYLKDLRPELINPTNPEAFYFVIKGVRIMIGSTDLSNKLKVLNDILREQVKGDFSSMEYIDLRYEKAYLGYRR